MRSFIYRLQIFYLLTIAMLLGVLSLAVAQEETNFSGLKGKVLSEADKLESGVQSLVGSFLSRDKVKGNIVSVTVTEDSERRLAVQIKLSGFEKEIKIWGETRNNQRKVQREVLTSSVDVKPDSGDTELVLNLSDKLPEGAQLESDFLYLYVGRPQKRTPSLVKAYYLGKNWQIEIMPENIVLMITPKPVGSAASITQTKSLPVPVKKIVLTDSKMFKKTAAPISQPQTQAPAVRPQQTKLALQRSTLIAGKIETKPKPATTTLKSAPYKIADQKRLVTADKFAYGVNKSIQDKNGKGPSAQPIYLLSEMRSDVDIEFEDILHVWPQVYQDQNPESGIFYFLPSAYHLKWTPDDGYGMRMLYFASQEEGEGGDVNVEMLVDAGIDSKEYEFANNLVLAYKARHPGTKFTELRPLPIDKAPEVSIAGGLQHTFNIPPEKIIITAISDALGQVHISLVTDWITKENLQLALFEDMGINGMLILTPAGGAMGAQQRPIKVTVADHRTLGRVYWERGKKWRNQAPYPVRLRYLHVLSLQNNMPIIHSWELDNTEVLPRAQVEWDSRYVPKELDKSAVFMWLDYKVEKSCNKCDEEVIAEITGGVTSVSADNITYETITPLADTGAYKIFIRTRSMFLHPTSRELKELPELPLNEDEQEYKIGPIYKVDRKADEATSGAPLFEYFITVVMPDGTTHKATKWLPSETLRVMIGQAQIKEALGFLPKKDI